MARKPTDKYKYIACTVYPGMLGNEYAVEINVRGTTFSLFADKEDVKVDDKVPGSGLLRVMIQDARTNLISLPGDTLEQGLRFLEFPIEQLRSA